MQGIAKIFLFVCPVQDLWLFSMFCVPEGFTRPSTGRHSTFQFYCAHPIPEDKVLSLPCPQVLSLLNTPFLPIIFFSYLSFHQETICLGMLFHLLIYMSPARQTPALILPQDNVNRINKPQWLHQSVCSSPSRTAEGALVLKYIQYSISDSSGLLLCLRDCLSAR